MRKYCNDLSCTNEAPCAVHEAPLSTPKELKKRNVDSHDHDLSDDWKQSGLVRVLNSLALTNLFTVIRDASTDLRSFRLHSDRLLNIISEEALGLLASYTPKTVLTPCGPFTGFDIPNDNDLVAISIMRSGNILLEAFQRVATGCACGHILIQRDPQNHLPKLFYSKLPPLDGKTVLLLDPMLGTGGSAHTALTVLLAAGAKQENLICVFVVGCPEGLNRLTRSYPKVRILCAAVDPSMNDNMYINPGLGDFGDRYYGT